MAKKTVKTHTKEYIHIRKDLISKSFAIVGAVLFAVYNVWVLILNWSVLNISELFKDVNTIDYSVGGWYQLGIIPDILMLYLSAGLLVYSIGYMLDKDINIYGLIDGFVIGLVIGLVIGFVIGFIIGFIIGLIYGLIGGLIGGLVIGLIYGFVIGLVSGLIGDE